VSAVMAVLDFHGESEELAARYDAAIHKVVAVSSARPLVHLAVPREYGFMVLDVWTSEEALRTFEQNEEFRKVLREAGMPEYKLRVFPVHSLEWPVEAMPLYR
jgi:quinol monooxygenase YgiN